jgi:hypothetical protein
MREFNTAAAQAAGEQTEQTWIEFKVDGVLCHAVGQPHSGQIAYLMARLGRKGDATKVSAMLNFFESSLDEDSQEYIADKLLDPADPFGAEEVEEILAWLMEEWTGRPIMRSSGSTSSPVTAGPSSTLPTPESTYSPYQPTGS